MRDWLIGQGVILYVFSGCLVVGVLSAFIANHGYKKLIRESELMGNTGNRLLKYIKLKFGSYYKLNMRPQDTRALTKHYIYKYKIGFMNVLSWIKLSKLAVGVIGISAIVYLLWMQSQSMSAAQMLNVAGCGLICGAFVYLQHRLYDFPEKQNMLEWYLMDYLENFLKNKIESAQGPAIAAAAGEPQGAMAARTDGTSGRQGAGAGYPDGANKRRGAMASRADGTGNRQEAAAARYQSTDGKNSGERQAQGGFAQPGLAEMDSEIFNNESLDNPVPAGSAFSRRSGRDYEAAAGKLGGSAAKRSEGRGFVSGAEDGPEDEIDAKIVEDILKEFLQ